MDQILIIDDDVALCELVTEYLEPLGFQIESVHRGDAGADRVQARAMGARGLEKLKAMNLSWQHVVENLINGAG